MTPSLSAIRSANLSKLPTRYTPVGVFVGGTSGIGQAMAEAFVQMTKGKATVVLVGRNKTAAESIIANLSNSADSEESKFEFVQCDVTLMRNVAAASKEILSKHSRINYLVLTPGFISMKGFDPTDEGIDRKLACHYYGRWKFISELLPALKSAKTEGQDAKVFSVMAASRGGAINLDDLGLKKTYSVTTSALTAPTYNDLMMEAYAEQNPDITFTHAYPGPVATNFAAASESRTMRTFAPLVKALYRPFAVSPAASAAYMWRGILEHTDGAFRIGSRGENLEKMNYFGDEEQRKALWEHTMEATKVA
ncbi:hypothetical protein NMY22_g9911 [Coprinellus aureogranulatus]|nr:hypothetical protein NMY22_g9911 [Coprinellus aureogranulatus]